MHKHRFIPLSFIGSRGFAAISLICSLGVISCKDKGAEQWKDSVSPDEQQQSAAEAKTAQMNVEQKELLDYMIFHIGKRVGEQANNALWRNDVRDMRNQLENYYNTLNAQGGDQQVTMRLGLLLADITRSMASYEKALKLYSDTLAKWEQQPEADRQTIKGRRMRSSIANGMGTCYLMQNKATEALPYYEESLEIDKAIFDELAPAENASASAENGADLQKAAEDILSSYRCLGDCQFRADDPEEARDTYKKGLELVPRLKTVSVEVCFQLIRLYSAQGDLECSCGQIKNAAAAWQKAYQLNSQLLKQAEANRLTSISVRAAQYAQKLEKSLKTIAPQLQEELKAAQEQENEAEPAEAPQE